MRNTFDLPKIYNIPSSGSMFKDSKKKVKVK